VRYCWQRRMLQINSSRLLKFAGLCSPCLGRA